MDKRNGLRCVFRIAVGILMLGLLLVHGVNATTITVPDDYAKIQWAIDNATAGDIIEVHSGTYYEKVNVTKQLTLRGIGMPVVDGNNSGSPVTLSANGITLEGFTASEGGSYYPYTEAGIKVSSNNNTLRENTASDNYYGIQLDSSSNNTLTGNTAWGNEDYGIYLDFSNNNTLTGNNDGRGNQNGFIYLDSSSNNTLSGNTGSSGGYGIYLGSSNNNTLTGNTLHGDYGIYLDSSSNNTLTGNNVSGIEGSGIYLRSSSNNTLSRNTADETSDCCGIKLSSSSNNMLTGNNASNNGYGIYLDSSSNNTLTGNKLSNNEYGISAYSSSNNAIYNNIFNNTNNFDFFTSNIGTWNITKTSGTNIIRGPYLGGNFWANPDGNGFSQICIDRNKDGICDLQYNLDSKNIDYLPLSMNYKIKMNKWNK